MKKSDICWEESIVYRKKYMNICIYTVHLLLYECITCKVKSCLSNYCTFHISYVTTNTQNNIHEKSIVGGHSWWWICCEEFDSLNENRLSFDQQAICSLLCKLQTIVLTVWPHVPKHLQFAQINKKSQSDVNEKLIVQRSEIIVSRKK